MCFDCPNVAKARGACRTVAAAGVPPLLAKDDIPTVFPLIPKLAYKKVEIRNLAGLSPFAKALA